MLNLSSTLLLGLLLHSAAAAAFPVSTIDLAAETQRQVIVDREPGPYLGHPTTVLLEDGKTMLIVYPKGHGKPGQYHVRLMDSPKGSDCAYLGVEDLPDATIVTTTYGHWTTNEAPYIVSVRLKLTELDAKAQVAPKPAAK